MQIVLVWVVPLPGPCYFFYAVSLPGDNITPPHYCGSLLQAEWQHIISWSFNTAKYFQPWYGISWHHVMLKAKPAWCLLASWLLSIVLCFGNQSTNVFVKQILTVDHNLEYEGHLISNQPIMFTIKIDRFYLKESNLYQDTLQPYVWKINYLRI